MKYDGINWAGWIVIILFYVVWCSAFFLMLGWGGIFFTGVLTFIYIYGIIKYVSNTVKNPRRYKRDYKEKSTFTNEDFLHCKVGEWVSRR